MFDGTKDWCKMWKENWLVLSKNFCLQVENIYFNGKIAELYWKQNLLIHFENWPDVSYSHE